MRLDQNLQQMASAAFETAFGRPIDAKDVSVQKTRREFPGDRTVVCFPLARHSQGCTQMPQPISSAEAMVKRQMAPSWGSMSSKGFLNLELEARLLGEIGFWPMRPLPPTMERQPAGSAPHVMVEYSSPNTNKPLHLGHLRNNFLGHSASAGFWQPVAMHGHQGADHQ